MPRRRRSPRTAFRRTRKTSKRCRASGRSTAAAIAVFAFGERAAILDGNAKRVLARCLRRRRDRDWELAERHSAGSATSQAYTQALMDLGATVCTRAAGLRALPGQPALHRAPRRPRRRTAARRGRRKSLPLRRARPGLCLRKGDEVLLERRPSPGIWGGLWCFPERLKGCARAVASCAPIEHGFTHFRLRIQPLLRDVRKKRRRTGAALDADRGRRVGRGADAGAAPYRGVLR